MFAYVTSAKTFIISSPDKQNTIRVRVDKDIRWSLSRGTEILLNENVINIKLTGGSVLGTNPVVLKTFAEKANETITAVIPIKKQADPGCLQRA